VKVKTIDSPVFITKIKNHIEHKNILLNSIEIFNKVNESQIKNIELNSKTKGIVKSDWNLERGEYLKYFYKYIAKEQIQLICDYLNLENWEINNGWFQQYNNKGEHNWHTHPNTQFTNVYYLELPDKKYKTQIKDLNNKILDFDVNEGDILTFPSYFIHKSKPNGVKRKTIISYNTSFY
jgi:hypothetical protein